MRRIFLALLISSLVLATIACDSEQASAGDPSAPAPSLTSGGDEVPLGGEIAGTVLVAMDASNYTYVKVDTGGEHIWAAGPQTPLTVGESIVLTGAGLMKDFHSKSLGRSFEQIYFVGSIEPASQPVGEGTSASNSHAGTVAPPSPDDRPQSNVTGVVRAENGQTIAEIFQAKADLSGSEVAVRGVVVKVNTKIMGRNWIHLEDGTVGPGGEAKLIVTSTETAEIGNTVLVRGTLATDRDLGHGYFYDALVEEASIAVE